MKKGLIDATEFKVQLLCCPYSVIIQSLLSCLDEKLTGFEKLLMSLTKEKLKNATTVF